MFDPNQKSFGEIAASNRAIRTYLHEASLYREQPIPQFPLEFPLTRPPTSLEPLSLVA